ncbi:5828_t:CDS:2, partial [Gigaspora rosea]
VTYAINRYLKLGFNLSQGTDIKNAIKGISGTQVAHLEPNRIKEINPTQLTKDKLEMELEPRKIDCKGLKRNELVNILQEKMTQEILSSDLNA